MKYRVIAASALIVSLSLLTGCATTANPFTRMTPDYTDLPVETIRAAVAEIEQAVVAGEREPVLNSGLNLDTPEIKQALRERVIRSPLVHGFLQTGHAYEQRGGLIAILRTKEYKKFGTSGDRDRNATIVLSENASRWVLYEGVLKANNFSPKNLSALQTLFAEARIALLPTDAAYEAEDGSIVRK